MLCVLRLCAVLRTRPEPSARPPPPAHQARTACSARAAAAVRGLRSRLEPPARAPGLQSAGTAVPVSRPVLSRSPRTDWRMLYAPALRGRVHVLFDSTRHASGMQGQHKLSAANSSNKFLAVLLHVWVQVCRFAAEAGTRGTCNIETSCMMACSRQCGARSACVSVWISQQSAQTCAAV